MKGAKRRKSSSVRWLQRQLNDPYVAAAKREGYRSRAAFKLLEIQNRIHVLEPNFRVIDLGCAPGGWCQVSVRCNCSRVIGVDLNEVIPIPGATIIRGDFRDLEVRRDISAQLGGLANCVLSDMAAPATGHRATDRLRVQELAEEAAQFACSVLENGGNFVAKVLRAGVPDSLRIDLIRKFRRVRHFKPAASRSDSDEIYLVALEYCPEKARI